MKYKFFWKEELYNKFQLNSGNSLALIIDMETGKKRTANLKDIENFIERIIEEAKKEERQKMLKEVENIKGEYLIRSQGVESEGIYLNKIDLLKKKQNEQFPTIHKTPRNRQKGLG